jgi:hypothetical protein
MGNQAGGQTENPAGGGQRGFWLGVWGLWLWPPSQSSNNDPETSFQNILRGRFPCGGSSGRRGLRQSQSAPARLLLAKPPSDVLAIRELNSV